MSVTVLLPTGAAASFPVSPDMTTAGQLAEKVELQTRSIPGLMCVRAGDMRLVLRGQTLRKSSLLVPSSVMHLTLRVRGG